MENVKAEESTSSPFGNLKLTCGIPQASRISGARRDRC